MTSPQRTDDEIADFLIGDELDPAVWGWPVINARYAHAFVYALGVATPIYRTSPETPDATAAAQRGVRVQEIISHRWEAAAKAHPDPDAKPSMSR